jgi:membrane protease YdiL (CAAX protease family)
MPDTSAAQTGAGFSEKNETGAGAGRLRWWIHLVLIGGYFIPILLLHPPRGRPVLTHSPVGLILVCTLDLAMFAVVFALAWMASRASCEQLFLYWRPGWWVVPLGVAYSLAIRLAIASIAIVVSLVLLTTVFDAQQLKVFWRSAQPDITSVVSVAAARSDPVYRWLLLTLVSFISAGLREELWRAGTLAGMRALWPKAFGSRNGQFAAIVLIAVMFGLGHFRMGILAAVVAGVLGLFLGLIMIIHRSIWPAVIAHGCFDGLSFALLAWLPSTQQPF